MPSLSRKYIEFGAEGTPGKIGRAKSSQIGRFRPPERHVVGYCVQVFALFLVLDGRHYSPDN